MSDIHDRWTKQTSTPDDWWREHIETSQRRAHREEMERIDALLDVLVFIPRVDLRPNVERSKAY